MRSLLSLAMLCFLLLIGGCKGCKGTTEEKPPLVDPRNISNNEGNSWNHSLTLDCQGNPHIVWSDSTPGNFEVFYSRKQEDGSWTGVVNISNSAEISDVPAIAIDPQGNVHAVWVEYEGGLMAKIMYTMKPPAGSWSTPIQISTGQWPDLCQIGVDAEGNVHVIWMEDRIRYVARSPAGGWSAPITISPHASWNPALCVTPQGYAHGVWEMSYVGGNEEIFYAERPPGSSWTEPINISNSPQWYSWVAKVTADGEGNVYVVWVEKGTDGLYLSARDREGNWATPQKVPTPAGGPWHSSLFVDTYGTLHLAWDHKTTNWDIWYITRSQEGSWSEPRNVSNTPGASLGPSLAVDAQSVVHIAWGDNTPGNWEIYYDRIE